ncbi:hypothetical protein JJE66_33690 [Bradyrhizobium diazoefficiens]|uniref:helix-turn-helix domain-containing protein n=1 Tax=Bradyrhizobium diazoefficiens TaxID=1355477 RepID=UPI00190BEC43|nr:helix-turn-helix domain-containing protein [Bradyrhizobium diazoefficiens]MBK3666161.1 hypothetical protein [Bradyrhizobium diazoefficiens]
MKHELSQNERVRRKLARDGSISRNQCLRQIPAITRLAARIDDLEHEGYRFKEDKRGNDYVYTVIGWPDGVRPETKLDYIADAKRKVALFDSGASMDEVFAV